MLDPDAILFAADTLGLERSFDRRRAEGLVDGRHVSVQPELLRQGLLTIVRGWLDEPLDLGLEVHRRELALLTANAARTGSSDLDVEFSVAGDEPARVTELFAEPLRERILALHRASVDVRLHDQGCSLYDRYEVSVDADWIVRAAHAAAAIVACMEEARAGVRPPAPLRPHVKELRAFAAKHGLAWAAAPIRASGPFEGRPLAIASARTGRRAHHLAIRAGFEAELGIGLAVRREKLLDGVRTWLGGQDVEVVDEAFDAHFLVRADPARAGRVALLLDREVREALRAIDERVGPVAIDDRGIAVAPIEATRDPASVVWAAEALGEVTGRISRNLLHGADAGGPYRRAARSWGDRRTRAGRCGSGAPSRPGAARTRRRPSAPPTAWCAWTSTRRCSCRTCSTGRRSCGRAWSGSWAGSRRGASGRSR